MAKDPEYDEKDLARVRAAMKGPVLDNDFEARAEYVELPEAITPYCQQFLMNLLAAGYTILSPQGTVMDQSNMKQGLKIWRKESAGTRSDSRLS